MSGGRRVSSPDPGSDLPEDDVEMGFFAHLAELRTRLIRALLGLIPGLSVGGFFHEELLAVMLRPYHAAWHHLRAQGVELPGDVPTIITLTPYAIFVSYVKVALITGIAIGAPWIFWQLWQFVSPGLYRREKRLAAPFVAASTLFFLGGAAFGYIVVFPLLFEYFLGFAGEAIGGTVLNPQYSLDEIFTLEFRLLLAFGSVFELPVVISFLAAARIVNWRQLLRFSRWWILVSAVLSAVLTPPDWTSQLLMLIPLVLLYFVSIGLAWMFGERKVE